MSLVTMEIDDAGLPIHKDATLKIRPRIFLEGNEFVDLSPGTPSAPTIDDGDTLPATQTAAPVQFDQILTALQSDTREDLKRLLEGYGTALTYAPTAADDVGQDPDVKGKTAAQSLNRSIDYAPGALKNVAIVNNALLGLQQHDLSGLVANTAKVTKALSANEESLKDLVTNFNTTLGALAAAAVQPPADDRPARPDAAAHRQRADAPQRLVPQHARLRQGDPPRRQGDAGDDRRRAAVDRPGAQARLARRARRPDQGAQADDGRPRQARRRLADRAAPSRPRRPVRDAHDPADRRRQDRRRAVHLQRGELQGVLVRHGRPRRREPELRRQRPLRALRGRRRRPDDLHRQVRRRRRQPSSTAGSTTRRWARGPPTRASARPTTPRRAARTRSCPTSTAPRPARCPRRRAHASGSTRSAHAESSSRALGTSWRWSGSS